MDQWMTNDRFTVVLGPDCYGFSKISNLTMEMEYDAVQEGGRNWAPLLMRKPGSRCQTITFERGKRINASEAPSFTVGTQLNEVIIIVSRGDSDFFYTFDEGVVTKLSLTDLDGMGREVLVEKMEVAHSGLYEI